MKASIMLLFITCLVFNSNPTIAQTEEFYGDSPISTFSIIGEISVNSYVKNYVELNIIEWQKKGEFETTSTYQNRVNEQSRNLKAQELTTKALEELKKTFSNTIDWKAIELGKYDADNQSFLIQSKILGDIAVKVPLTEAPEFKNYWSQMKFQNYDFYVLNDKLYLAKLDIVNPAGKCYSYDNKQSTVYSTSSISYNFKPIEVDVKQDNVLTGNTKIETKEIVVGISDVGINIPINPQNNDKSFVLIFANENYRREANVPFAINDGSTFKEYCEKTLGIPSQNIHFSIDATFGEMRSEINWLTQVISAFKGEAKVIFYYAGHGMPDEKDRTAYLLPTDGFSSDYQTAIKLNYLYEILSKQPAKSITIFLDACFSGTSRDDIMLAVESGQRAVRVRPREETPKGNMVVVSAASGDETAFPYKEKQHGLFTYFLLQKLQQTKGNIDLQTLTNHIINSVSQQSILINNKKQTPQVNSSPEMQEKWKFIKLN